MSAEGLTVRMAGVNDLSEVLALERSIPEAPHWAAAVYLAAVAPDQEGVRRCLFVAEMAGCLVGYVAAAAPEGIAAELESVAVGGGHRRAGVGQGALPGCHAVGVGAGRDRDGT